MVYQKRINEAKERMNRAEDALKGYTLSNPCNTRGAYPPLEASVASAEGIH